MDQHVMIDLETLGKGPYAAIWTIGAVKFNPNFLPETEDEALATTERFHARCDLQSVFSLGLRLDADTLNWWMNKDRDEARNAITIMESEDIRNVLQSFTDWFGESKPTWGNGAMFDNTIMTNAFALANVKCPWSYRHDRCFRTFKNLPFARNTVPPDYGVGHTALDDAMSQAWHMQRIVRALGTPL